MLPHSASRYYIIVAILAAASRQQRTASARKRLSDGQYSTDYLLTVLNINNVDLSQLQDVAPLKESVFLAVLLSDIVEKDIEETGTLTSWPFNSLHRLLFSELAFETLTAELIESLDEDMKEYEDHEKIYTDGIVRKQK
ncbi:PREDICTED: uncharacterized protein LOC106810297 [Priapulus caudatus]|uniref:Uncharacterized protein LOC106810297 n=1 Tax=Priapulus caudatus TaxID=37621 RepID=A0ABM1EA70_PRICU|nr:PREDICTED: uncharacterized protein LOC106810297 [Priapulus caudatus]